MLVSLQWLKQYVDINESIEELEMALTMIGQEVEAIEEQGKYLNKVVVGELLEVEKHPEAEKLTVCKVKVGEDKVLQIVCGAKNHKVGDKVAAATDGAVLPGDFKIKKSKLRGVESHGMLCSEKELELSEGHDGIMILPPDAPVGMELKEYLKADDVVFELEITPNRPDCLSHIGIAREVAAYYKRDLKEPAKDIAENGEKNSVNVQIDAPDLCGRYSARVIKGVEIKESPEWLRKRLSAIGIRSINNVVDITNFVMMEYGHPIHAFDYDKISGNKIVVRRAADQEKITTLDGKERELDSNMIVIADGEKAVALAGIMGGANSEVDNKTKSILLEVAHFQPENIRKNSKKLGLSSDSSYRFERGVDIEDCLKIADRAAKLIQEVAGGEILSGTADAYPAKPESKEIVVNLDKLNKFIGKEIPANEVKDILERLELKVEECCEGHIKVVPPSFRGDLERVADIYEEVLRMYGFANVEAKMPLEEIKPGIVSKENFEVDYMKKQLKELGLQEVINYSFIPENALEKVKMTAETIKLMNPINEDMVIMRPTLIYSLLTNIRDNFNRNIFDLKIFEVSRTFIDSKEKLPFEPVKMGIAIAGRDNRNLWNAKPENYDFYDLKGIVDKFMENNGLKKAEIRRSSHTAFHPGRSADICAGKDVIGTFGEIHPDVLENLGIEERVYIAEIDMVKFIKYSKNKIDYKRVVKYPAVGRDFAIVLPEDVLVGNMLKEMEKISNLVESVELFDIYRGEKVGENLKSAAVNLVFRADDRTLGEEEINGLTESMLKMVETKFGGKLRS